MALIVTQLVPPRDHSRYRSLDQFYIFMISRNHFKGDRAVYCEPKLSTRSRNQDSIPVSDSGHRARMMSHRPRLRHSRVFGHFLPTVRHCSSLNFCTQQHHTAQESGGVWFFFATTPKHHRSAVLYCGYAKTPNRG